MEQERGQGLMIREGQEKTAETSVKITEYHAVVSSGQAFTRKESLKWWGCERKGKERKIIKGNLKKRVREIKYKEDNYEKRTKDNDSVDEEGQTKEKWMKITTKRKEKEKARVVFWAVSSIDWRFIKETTS